jgi:hypothetical protein
MYRFQVTTYRFYPPVYRVQLPLSDAKTGLPPRTLWMSTVKPPWSARNPSPDKHSACIYPVRMEIPPRKFDFLFPERAYSRARFEPENRFRHPKRTHSNDYRNRL